jgi:hypothetical protein
MLLWITDIAAYTAFAGFGYLLWHFWGQAARHVGVSRLGLLGSLYLLAWWL